MTRPCQPDDLDLEGTQSVDITAYVLDALSSPGAVRAAW